MREQCKEIEGMIERFRQVKRTISDELTVQRAKKVIADLETQKMALHSK